MNKRLAVLVLVEGESNHTFVGNRKTTAKTKRELYSFIREEFRHAVGIDLSRLDTTAASLSMLLLIVNGEDGTPKVEETFFLSELARG